MTKYFLVFCLFLSHQGFSDSFCPRRYIGVEFGYSFSTKTKVKTPERPWEEALQKYNNDLNSSAIYGLILGYRFSELFRADVSYQYRPDYTYIKKERNTRDEKKCSFDLSNESVMINGYMQGSGFSCLSVDYCGIGIEPYLSLGIGISYSTISSFHSQSSLFPGEVYAMMGSNKSSSFSWQVGLGLDFCTSCVIFSTGYRYFQVDKWKTNTYLIDDPDITSFYQGTNTKPWKGKLQTHEIACSIRYPF